MKQIINVGGKVPMKEFEYGDWCAYAGTYKFGHLTGVTPAEPLIAEVEVCSWPTPGMTSATIILGEDENGNIIISADAYNGEDSSDGSFMLTVESFDEAVEILTDMELPLEDEALVELGFEAINFEEGVL